MISVKESELNLRMTESQEPLLISIEKPDPLMQRYLHDTKIQSRERRNSNREQRGVLSPNESRLSLAE